MEEFSLIRHGHKLQAGEERKPIDESGLNTEQQESWKDALSTLPENTDPEITYENVPLVEDLADQIYENLPPKALLLFSTTDYPRTRMTASLLSCFLAKKGITSHEKDIAVGYVWEPKDVAVQEGSLTRLPSEMSGVVEKWKALQAREAELDDSLREYFAQPGGGKTHPRELEMFFKLVEEDLASPDSAIRKRGEEMKQQVEKFKETYKDEDRPVFFYGVGHISSLVCLDVAFNSKESYSGPEELPKPLSLWKANIN
jgi:hypothetical protein